jgi:hypothetical protein
MTWGDEVFIATKMIDNYYDRQGMKNKQYELYSEYGHYVLGSKTSRVFINGIADHHFTADTWFVFARISRITYPAPPFLTEVEPIMKLKYRGMTAMWIYRGDQLVDYKYMLNGRIDYWKNPA